MSKQNATMYFVKSHSQNLACLKVMNTKGQEFSYSADDSCGVFDTLCRSSLMVYGADGKPVAEEQNWVSPETFLKALADHLGFDITPKQDA